MNNSNLFSGIKPSLTWRIIIACLILTTGTLLLYLGNPETSRWFPKCIFHSLTGLNCPACGTQRALHQLFHLNINAAFRYNPFLIISLPYLAALIWVQWFDPEDKFCKLRYICHHNRTIKIYFLLILFWWIGRNLF
ncbi:MAG: DUF2752 domain-containing protein [Bacteroides sp.]|nr:DUF2752 domain-containing protein [Bacteroides sp.]